MAEPSSVAIDDSAGLAAALVGVWDSPRLEYRTDDGPWRRFDLDSGRLIYTADGYMVTILTIGCEDPDFTRQFGRSGGHAYSGPYVAVAPDTVVHHVDSSLPRSSMGHDAHRHVQFDGDRMTLTAPTFTTKTGMQTWRCGWRRASTPPR